MKMIVGLGNPGKKYEQTRHNIGFLVINHLIYEFGIDTKSSTSSKFNAIITEALVDRSKVLLVKPLTYMNLSGEAVRPILDWYKIDIDDMVMIYDDLDLPLGKVRFREKGSAGGHKGVNSIIQHTGTSSIKRVKIGIDHPQNRTVVDYVLTPFTQDEKPKIEESIYLTSKALMEWLRGAEFKQIMNTYH